MAKTLTIELPDNLAEPLGAMADTASVAVTPLATDPLAALIGTLYLGTTDLAENHDRHIAEALEQELLVSE